VTIRQWAFIERLSAGLYVLRFGHHKMTETCLAVADMLARA
jgi:hypothetical protein